MGEYPPYRQNTDDKFALTITASARARRDPCTHTGDDHRSYRWLVTPHHLRGNESLSNLLRFTLVVKCSGYSVSSTGVTSPPCHGAHTLLSLCREPAPTLRRSLSMLESPNGQACSLSSRPRGPPAAPFSRPRTHLGDPPRRFGVGLHPTSLNSLTDSQGF